MFTFTFHSILMQDFDSFFSFVAFDYLDYSNDFIIPFSWFTFAIYFSSFWFFNVCSFNLLFNSLISESNSFEIGLFVLRLISAASIVKFTEKSLFSLLTELYAGKELMMHGVF